MTDNSSYPRRFGRFGLLVALLVAMVGASMPTLVYDGAAFSKYLVNQDVKERAHESEIDELSATYLFGSGEVDMDRLGELSKDAATASENNLIWAEQLYRVEYWGLIVLLGLLVMGILAYRWLADSWLTVAVVLVAGAYLFLQAWGITLNGGKPFAEWSIAAHATRWGLALMITGYIVVEKFETKLKAPVYQTIIDYWAIACCAATFAAHGWEALNHHPAFQDLIYGSTENFGFPVSETVVNGLLTVIGIMDLCIAVLVLIRPSRPLLLWMFVWAGATALSRPLSMGIDAWYEVAVRAANYGIPLFLAYSVIPSRIKGRRQRGKGIREEWGKNEGNADLHKLPIEG